MHRGFKILTVALIVLYLSFDAIAQIKGIEPSEEKTDTIFTFISPRPLIANTEEGSTIKTAWGMELVFSGNGFGLGMFYQRKFLKDWCVFSNLYISGARNTDEIEFYDYRNQMYYIPGKINRLFIVPLTVGVQRYLFSDVLHSNLQPFINFGIGESLIIEAPYLNYENSFFKAIGKAELYGRFAGFIGIGANVGGESKAFMSINMRYYYIPFGEFGLESVKDSPIKDFGGLFLSLSLGTAF